MKNVRLKVFLLLFLLLTHASILCAAPLIYQQGNTKYSILVFESKAPTLYAEHSIVLDSASSGYAVFIYDGTSYSITCNGNWFNLNPAPGIEIQNMISCLYNNDPFIIGGSQIDASIRLFDQNLYDTENIHLMAPEYDDSNLNGTSGASPFCLDDNHFTASACKWQVQNLDNILLNDRGVPIGSWAVYARTDVTDLHFTLQPPPEYLYSESDIACFADLDTDGDIAEDETALCVDSSGDDHLCPLGAVNCVYGGWLCPMAGNPCFIDWDGSSRCKVDCVGDPVPTCPLGNYPCVPNEESILQCSVNCYRPRICPLGSYPCIRNSTGVFQCSPYPCSAFDSDIFSDEDTTEGENDLADNGPVDANGSCLGTVYIFSGNDKRCRTKGISTQYRNCCKDQYSSYLLSMDICEGKEVELTQLKEKGSCHYIGRYCSERLAVIGCVQRKRTYCCFHSKLSRIVNEQGRIQLQAFGADGGWGTAKNPNCRGFTVNEFQMIEFDLIDLSDWYGDIQTETTEEIQNDMDQQIQTHF